MSRPFLSVMRTLILLLSVLSLLTGCEDGSPWRHRLGRDSAGFAEDARQCSLGARERVRAEGRALRVPRSAPHAGVAEALILYAVYEDCLIDCMRSKGWYRAKKRGPKTRDRHSLKNGTA